jgi:hypothetical protein
MQEPAPGATPGTSQLPPAAPMQPPVAGTGAVTAPAGDRFADQAPGTQPSTTEPRRKARYDCAICHY